MEAVLLGAVCAMGLGWSAVTVRTVSSVVMTYLTVAALALGSFVLFGLTAPLVSREEVVTLRYMDPLEPNSPSAESFRCVEENRRLSQFHSERTWWMLAVNPFVVVADAAPGARSLMDDDGLDMDAFDVIRLWVQTARTGPSLLNTSCGNETDGLDITTALSWPYGLAVNLGLGGIGMATAVRRLRTPVKRLARGQRIA